MWNFLSQSEENCLGPLKSYLKTSPKDVSEYSSEETSLLAKLLVWHDIPYFKLSAEGRYGRKWMENNEDKQANKQKTTTTIKLNVK